MPNSLVHVMLVNATKPHNSSRFGPVFDSGVQPKHQLLTMLYSRDYVAPLTKFKAQNDYLPNSTRHEHYPSLETIHENFPFVVEKPQPAFVKASPMPKDFKKIEAIFEKIWSMPDIIKKDMTARPPSSIVRFDAHSELEAAKNFSLFQEHARQPRSRSPLAPPPGPSISAH